MADCFIQFDQINGESEDAEYKGAIMVIGWSWGVNWRAEHGMSGKNSGKGDVRHFTFTHIIDTASPALMARCVIGKEIPTATLFMRRAGGTSQLYAKIQFDRVRLVNVDLEHNAKHELPEEVVTFSFQQVRYEYAAQSIQGGRKGGWIPFNWNSV